MKALVFDSGPVISMTLNNLLWLLEPLKQLFGGDFLIPEAVRMELVDNPLHTKKFMFEALQVHQHVDNGTLTLVPDAETKEATLRILNLANTCFSARGHNITIVHYAEAAVLAAAKARKADAVVLDERITRELIEHPLHIAGLMKHKLHSGIDVSRDCMRRLKAELGGFSVLRSTELAAVAFEHGLLDRYISGVHHTKKVLLESVLWGMKTDGCAISRKDIERIIKLERLK